MPSSEMAHVIREKEGERVTRFVTMGTTLTELGEKEHGAHHESTHSA
jgi:hypothetical protein